MTADRVRRLGKRRVDGRRKLIPRHRKPHEWQPTEAYQRACRIRSSGAWQKARNAMIARQPVCQWCGRREAEHVHHIDPVSECPEKALDQDNLLPLCRRCHELIETATRRGADVRRMLEARNGG